jgi:hypothetical protein
MFLFLSAICSALVVGPRIYEQDDLGDPMFSEFTYSLSVDCNASTINLIVMNESNRPVQDAQTYLKYVDFSTPVVSNVKTDKDGFALIRLPGNVKFMRGLFILVIEKRGFRSKEVHFDLSPCLTNGVIPAKPQNQTQNPAQNQTQNPTAGNDCSFPAPPCPGDKREPGTSASSPAQNWTGQNQTGSNATNASNQTGQANATGAGGAGGVTAPCAAFLGLSSLLFLKSFKRISVV